MNTFDGGTPIDEERGSFGTAADLAIAKAISQQAEHRPWTHHRYCLFVQALLVESESKICEIPI